MFFFEIFGFPVSLELLLAVLFGFFIGQMRRDARRHVEANHSDLRRASAIISELESVASQLRRAVKKHRHSVHQFKDRMATIAMRRGVAWGDLSSETDKVLQPTLRLANEIASAYEQIKQQSALLLTLTESRLDPLTGVGNRRVMDDAIQTMFAVHSRYETKFSVAVFDIDHFKKVNDEKGHLYGDQTLMDLGELLKENARESDVVTRFGGEEFVMLMPETDLEGAQIVAERVRQAAAEKLDVTLSGGVATADDCDSPTELIESADKALYEAKANGRNRIFKYDNGNFEAVTAGLEPQSASSNS